jgi:hypothetical protein
MHVCGLDGHLASGRSPLSFRSISFARFNLPGRSFPLLRLMLYECIYGIEEPSLYNPRLRKVSFIAANHL